MTSLNTTNKMPEFPVDRFLRKHVGPWRFLGFLVALSCGTFWVRHYVSLDTMIAWLIWPLLAVIIFKIVWWFYWIAKYPVKIEFCKECGQAKRIKYED
jgi:hypothetical protein